LIARVLAGAALLFASSAAAFACQGTSNPALDENFKQPDPGWGETSDQYSSASPQGLSMQPPVNGGWWWLNTNYTMDGSDVCLQIVMAAAPAPTQGANGQPVSNDSDAGLLFWSKDAQNFYTATIAPDGSYGVYRLIAGKWTSIVAETPSPAIKTAAGSINEVELTVSGNAGSFYINGTKVADIHGQAPPDGGSPGIYCESGSAAATTWVFPRFQIY